MSDFPSVSILDHGYIRLIESWGSDERIIEAARMSTNKGFQGWGSDTMYVCPKHGILEGDYRHGDVATNGSEYYCSNCLDNPLEPTIRGRGDERLLAYLYSHKHSSPFEFAGLVLEIQAPIFVFREWHRHRTQSYAEMSSRYMPLPDFDYTPTIERCMQSGGSNKQAQSASPYQLTEKRAELWLKDLTPFYIRVEQLYQEGLALGIPKELARLVLPVARYSRMRASANLRNWLAFLTLRMDSNAQWEIRQYANEVGNIISQLFPRTWALFTGEREQQK